MSKKKIKISGGLNKMVYDDNEEVTDGVKMPTELLKMLCEEGEILGVELSRQMKDYGLDYFGFFIRTFALSQTVAYLKVFAAAKGFDAMAMFDILTPKFTKEAQEMLEKIEAKERQIQRSGFKFLDLNSAAGAKEFKKILKEIEKQ